MACTYDEIVRTSQDIHVARTPTSALQGNYRLPVSLSAGGQVGDAQGLSKLVGSADDSTASAVLSERFFAS